MKNLIIFQKAIDDTLVVELRFKSSKGRVLTKTCIPFDYGPSRRCKNDSNRYHFLVLHGPKGRHPLSILPRQVIHLKLTDEHFNPAKFIHWSPRWFLKRDWGDHS